MILSVLDGADVVYVAVRNGIRPLGMAFSVGMRLPAYRAATGRAARRTERTAPAGAVPPAAVASGSGDGRLL